MAGRGTTSACAIFSAWAIVCAVGCPMRAIGGPFAPAASTSAYRAYATAQADLLARMTRVFATDIRDGNVEAAQNDYAITRKYLERIRPLVATQPDLARRMDASADDFPDKDRDPSFGGFHRIEHGLFMRRSTDGLAGYADRLHDDAVKLREAARKQRIAAELLLEAPAALLETASAGANSGGREPYSQTDLWDIEANVEGTKAIVAAVRPQVEARDPSLMPRITAAFEATDARLAQLRDGCGFKPFGQLTSLEKAGLRETTAALARELTLLKAVPAID